VRQTNVGIKFSVVDVVHDVPDGLDRAIPIKYQSIIPYRGLNCGASRTS
jgi:hypothetical protein